MKVLIIDGQTLFADGIRYLLKTHDPNIQTDYAGDIFTVYDKVVRNNSPDLLFLGINENGSKNGYDLVNRLKKIDLHIPLIVMSDECSKEAAALAIENNAWGFVAKNSSHQVVLEAISSVMDGRIYITKPQQPIIYETKEAPKTKFDKVTSRQQEVLYLLSQGLLNKQIANELDISANTVKAHLHDLFRSLHVTNRTAAVKNGQKYGLI